MRSEVLCFPNVSCLYRATEPEFAEVHPRRQRFRMSIEDSYSLRSICQGTNPDFNRAFSAHSITLLAGGILIDCNHVTIREQSHRLRRHGCQVVPSKQGRGEDRP